MFKKNGLLYVEACKYCDAGKLITREAWGKGYGRFVFMRQERTLSLHACFQDTLPTPVKEYFERNYTPAAPDESIIIQFSGHLCLKAEDGRIIIGWEPSQADKEAFDWYVLEA
jgi:hypothetical protein